MHDVWTDRLSEYFDDDLAPGEREQVEAHLATCAGCARVLDELRLVVDRASALPPRAPGADLWPGVAARLEHTRVRAAGERPRWFTFAAPQLAAAAVLVALLSGWMARSLLVRDDAAAPVAVEEPAQPAVVEGGPAALPAAFETRQYDDAVADLERTLAVSRQHLDPTTIAVVEENLAIIDRAIDEARRALTDDPANSYVSGHLTQTRRRKLDLLRYAAALSVDGN